MKKRMCSFLLVSVACLLATPIGMDSVQAAERVYGQTYELEGVISSERNWGAYKIIATGTCGKDAENPVTYTLYQTSDRTYCLRLQGTGSTGDYVSPDVLWPIQKPWDGELNYEQIYTNADRISEIVVEEGITRLGNGVFSNMKNPQIKVSLPSTLKVIGDNAFFDSNITSITIPDSVEEIGNNAFKETELETVTLPKSLKKLGTAAFARCYLLKRVEWNETLTEIPDRLFYESDLSEYKMASCIQTVGSFAFMDTNITSIQLPDGLREIRERAFYATAIKEITIPEHVTKLGAGVFQSCKQLKKVKWNCNVKEIPQAMFQNSGLTKFTVPACITTIGTQAFQGCSKLKTVYCNKKLTAIGKMAFRKCTSLSRFRMAGNVKKVAKTAFRGCDKLKRVEVPKANLKTYKRIMRAAMQETGKLTLKAY